MGGLAYGNTSSTERCVMPLCPLAGYRANGVAVMIKQVMLLNTGPSPIHTSTGLNYIEILCSIILRYHAQL